jgi:hypothetical protein
MKPQLQSIRGNDPERALFGDCHRTCIAMILDLDRDEVPHFMAECPPGLPPDDPRSQAAEQAERDWLLGRGLVPVYVPYPGDLPLTTLLEQLKVTARDTAVILGCKSGRGSNHSVVVYDGLVYNPNEGFIAGPMTDGMWWVTIYAHATNPLPQTAQPGTVVTQEED